jgi:hypothetical protein
MTKRLTILGASVMGVAIVLFIIGTPRQLVLLAVLVAVLLSGRVAFQHIRAGHPSGVLLRLSVLPLLTCAAAVAFVLLNWTVLVRGVP